MYDGHQVVSLLYRVGEDGVAAFDGELLRLPSSRGCLLDAHHMPGLVGYDTIEGILRVIRCDAQPL